MNKFACGKSVLSKHAKGFTLSEVMIVLVVIGVITGILLPTAIQSTPDKNVMKFKKGYNTLGQVIRELVTSDKYYKDGDLGIRANGELIDGTHDGDYTYFCETFADVLNIKSKNCSEKVTTVTWLYWDLELGLKYNNEASDTGCRGISTEIGSEIITSDGITFFQTWPEQTFGWMYYDASKRFFGILGMETFLYDGFPRFLKTFCMDIDGIGIGEDPFGFGIRADGKILSGARANEWINKSIQKEE